jgi:hypothetical protein
LLPDYYAATSSGHALKPLKLASLKASTNPEYKLSLLRIITGLSRITHNYFSIAARPHEGKRP